MRACAYNHAKWTVVDGLLRGGLGRLLGGGTTLTEAVLEAAVDRLEVGAAAGAGGLPALGLEAPVVGAELGRGVATLSTGWG
jgi:hypothetical protein